MGLPRLAVYKMTSCDGCQLSILDCEDELLSLAQVVEIGLFPEATSAYLPPPYDVGLVEGSISMPEHLHQIEQVRKDCKFLVAIGACATSGGIQALRNFASVEEFSRIVYAHPEYIQTLHHSTPISEHVKVDFELRGCPIQKEQLIEVLTALLQGRNPQIANQSVCVECKRAGQTCLLVNQGVPCLGPVTHAGCQALCPRFARGCFGCFGPKELANPHSLNARLRELGVAPDTVRRLYSTFNVAAPAFYQVNQASEENT